VKKNTILFILFISLLAYGQENRPAPNRFVKTWKITDKFGRVDTIPVDTAHLNFQIANPIDRFSIANSFNGNLGSPIQSKIYFDRPDVNNFIFANAYYPYITQIESTTFYNTKSPFSSLKYLSGGTNYREEEQIAFLFTANANKKLNFGTTLDYIYARGEYNRQSAKRFTGSFFGSYDGKRYSAKGIITTNNIKNIENGGITDPVYITRGTDLSATETKDIPVKMTDDVQSTYKLFQFYYHHQYSLGFNREIKNAKDSIINEFVPVTKIGHSLRIDDMRKRYYENTIQTAFYKTTYLPVLEKADTAGLRVITNRFSISLAEEFNKWMHFGLTAYVENEIENYLYRERTLVENTDALSSGRPIGDRKVYDLADLYPHQSESSTRVGGILAKELGQKFTYSIQGEITPLGYKAGDILLSADFKSAFRLWKDTIMLQAKGFIRSDEPSFFDQYYQSNHFSWINNFDKIYRTRIGGRFAIPTRSLWLDVAVENVSKLVYYDTLALPVQHDGNVQIMAANLRKDFHLGKFSLENNVVYQLSSNQNVIPLPALALYHNLYYHDLWFKVLSVQIGADVRYHSSYYAPAYMPATGQFHIQNEMKIGNYPVISPYANFHLKRTRFFIQYYHLNQLFMKDVYYSMPYYPINPAIFKIGLTWNFYN